MLNKQQNCKFFIRVKRDTSKPSGFTILSSYAKETARPRNIIRIRLNNGKSPKGLRVNCKAH